MTLKYNYTTVLKINNNVLSSYLSISGICAPKEKVSNYLIYTMAMNFDKQLLHKLIRIV